MLRSLMRNPDEFLIAFFLLPFRCVRCDHRQLRSRIRPGFEAGHVGEKPVVDSAGCFWPSPRLILIKGALKLLSSSC
jgi:hypothetical protein